MNTKLSLNIGGLLAALSAWVIFADCCKSPCKAFLEKYRKEDFSPFKNKYILNRGIDHSDHSSILFVYDERDDGPYMVKVNRTSGKIVGTSTHLMKDASNPDSVFKQQLAMKFIRYHVDGLDVDSVGNVFVWITHDQPDLIRVAGKIDMPGFDEKHYRETKDNWYVSKECWEETMSGSTADVVKYRGFLISWKKEFLFFPSENNSAADFIKSVHQTGFRVETEISTDIIDKLEYKVVSYNFYDHQKDKDTIGIVPVIVYCRPYNSKAVDGEKNNLIFYYDAYESVYEYHVYKDVSVRLVRYSGSCLYRESVP
nr:hypothetical protein [uncultured Chitinophaga sp.]